MAICRQSRISPGDTRVSVYESVVVAVSLRIARDPKESGPVGSRGVLPFLRSRKWDFMATQLWNVANSEQRFWSFFS
jgi:hypothetical protein